MNLNVNSRFSANPVDIDIERSRFSRSSRRLTTMNAGKLVPIYLDEVLPGDTFDMKLSSLIRMSTPIHPVMDNAYLDTYFFFVPHRLVWSHWEAMNGQNDDTYWTQPTEYMVPQLRFPSDTGFNKGSVADHFGIPINSVPYRPLLSNLPNAQQIYDDEFTINALPFRSYVKVWNDWFRDQNYMNPAYFVTDDVTRDGKMATFTDDIDEILNSALYGGDLLPVAKYHDYFTSVLPEPQKGEPVSIGISTSGNGIPVQTGVNHSTSAYPLMFSDNFGTHVTDETAPLYITKRGSTQPIMQWNRDQAVGTGGIDLVGAFPSNLWAVDSTNSLSVLVNDLRLGFQLQKLYEKDARGGTRYIELIKAHFGVESPDGRLQRSEYLGGSRMIINIQQVAQTSSTDAVSPQGNMSAYSLTIGNDNSFIKSFTEHGYIIGVACVRTDHTYQQGINKLWSRKRRFDFYWPVLANIGEQPVLKKEIFLGSEMPAESFDYGDNAFPSLYADDAFGYQEAWAEYRYQPSIVTGAFRSTYAQSLDSWHYADDFTGSTERFVADANFMIETKNNIDRTLAVSSDLEDQFLCDFSFNLICTRPMPMYSIPGLIDHH